MASSTNEVVLEIPYHVRVYKDGRVERLSGTEIVPPSVNSETGVQSKDVVIVPDMGLSARLYIPKITNPHQKLPLLIYFHGGGFCIETPFSPTYHNYLNSLVAEAKVVAVSVHYRRAPEDPLPVAYDDSWAAIKWAASHSGGGGHEVWLKDYVDFDHMFFSGDSAGANLAHHMAVRVGSEGLDGAKLAGIALVHSYFWGKTLLPGETAEKNELVETLWRFTCPASSDCDDPLINPLLDPKFSSVGCAKVLVCIAGTDGFRFRGRYYHDELSKSGWQGVAEVTETAGEDHVFHLLRPTSANAGALLKRVAGFLNGDKNA